MKPLFWDVLQLACQQSCRLKDVIMLLSSFAQLTTTILMMIKTGSFVYWQVKQEPLCVWVCVCVHQVIKCHFLGEQISRFSVVLQIFPQPQCHCFISICDRLNKSPWNATSGTKKQNFLKLNRGRWPQQSAAKQRHFLDFHLTAAVADKRLLQEWHCAI